MKINSSYLQKKYNSHFELLKKEIVSVMQQSFPGISPEISEWRGQDIVNFQEELLQKINAQISEKWFYTHMKSRQDALPRIDVLNFLSKYVGYHDWNDFIHRNENKYASARFKSGNRYFVIVPLLVIMVLGALYLIFKFYNTQEYNFCFYDAVTKEPIVNNAIEVSLLYENESPVNYLCDSTGCFTLKTDQGLVKMLIKSPYFKSDTIRRQLKKFNRNEMIGLRVNEYALMLRYFSEMNVKDWKKRRAKLDEIFDDDALIYQVIDSRRATGMELYSKLEFIDKLTMPSRSLKNIEILDTKYVGNQIMILQFRIRAE